jgi:hypothetical protein
MNEIVKVWQFQDEEGIAEVGYSFNYDELENLETKLISWSFKDKVYGQKDSATEDDAKDLIKYLTYLYMSHRTCFDDNLHEREHLLSSLGISYDYLWDKGIQIIPTLKESRLAFRLCDGQKIWQYHTQFFLEQLNKVVVWLPDGYEQVLKEFPAI